MSLILRKVSDSVFHVSEAEKPSSMLSRYGIINNPETPICKDDLLSYENGRISFGAKRNVEITISKFKKDYELTVPLTADERLYGGGDSNRENVMIRGSHLVMHIANVRSYGPMPILLSSEGWAILLNTTYSSVFDCDSQNKGMLNIRVLGGEIDFYLFRADNLKSLVGAVTTVNGRPMIMPKFAYGYTFVMNQNANLHDLLETARIFREKEIPCDSIGLEPDWMSKHYDFSIDKKWNQEKFPQITWQPANQCGKGTMFYPLRRMGIQLSLWLCEDYDLIYHEEKISPIEEDTEFPEDAEILDPHLVSSVWLDKITKRDERWFEHLKKFVDNGANAFKLDGSNQVLAHPDRLWGGKYLDEEVHNVYPVLLVKDMQTGFEEYTDRRVLLNTAGAYVGTPKYASTWAGDTGGGPRTLVSLMNYAMCGHSNTGCDIDIHSMESMHYGFLTPWTQQNSWDYHHEPWYLGDDIFNSFVFYSKLRSSLFPYIYSAAHNAYHTGISILRPMALMYEDDRRFDNVKNMYMLGDSLLVGAFDMHLSLPEGRWIDYFTGEVYEGGREIDYVPPKGLGGALFIREGDVIVTMKPQKYVMMKDPDYVIDVYPSERESSFVLYEDDGQTFDYRNGGYATTKITSSGIIDGKLTLNVAKREGSYSGRPDNGHDIINNSIPEISPMKPLVDFTVKLHGVVPSKVTLGGETVEFTVEDGSAVFVARAEMHAVSDLEFTVEI